jgi:2-amino-4-hydroxy-6-hydroxymethyldihydropteridine diphosphokinase
VHQVYLSLGSNIEPEVNLPRAIELLAEHGEILKLSRAWESAAVGSDGPNFLNACALFLTPLPLAELKAQVIHPIEAKLGRKRTSNKYAPRPIDIDAVLFDDQSCHDKFWKLAFVVIPLAEINPQLQNPVTNESIFETATRLRQGVWMEVHPEVLNRFDNAYFRSQY